MIIFYDLLTTVFFSVLAFCPSNVLSVNFIKKILINQQEHQILGSLLKIDGVDVEYFAKIPYAVPPLGDLRFKHPKEIVGQSWKGIYNSTEQPNTCWQAEPGEFDKLNMGIKLWYSKTNLSEDCLYLTVWAPRTTDSSMPVMVWIYGGSFMSGSSTLEIYDGSILAAKHKVVVVSLQYRVGPLGFLYLDDNEAPGNQGLMDQRLALKWIKQNIMNFNGDDNKITIFGESAGSGSVSLHVLSPLSQNFFNRAIMESGSALAPWVVEGPVDAKEKSIELGKYLACDMKNMEKLATCLRSIDVESLFRQHFELKSFIAQKRRQMLLKRGFSNIKTDTSSFFDLYFRPVYDNYFIPKPIDELIRAQSARKNIDLLMGFNRNEGMFFILFGLNKWLNVFNKGSVVMSNVLNSDNSKQFKPSEFLMENLAGKKLMHKSLIPLLLHEYKIPSYRLGWTKWSSAEVLNALDQFAGDELFICPVIDFAETMVENKQNVFMYTFEHRTDRMTFPKWAGTMHGYEIEYVFGMPYSEKFTNMYYSFSDNEKKLSDYVMQMWANFAKFGNPTPNSVDYFGRTVKWPPFVTNNKQTFVFATPDDAIPEPFRKTEKSEKCKFWNKVIPPLVSRLTDDNSRQSGTVLNLSPAICLVQLAILCLYFS